MQAENDLATLVQIVQRRIGPVQAAFDVGADRHAGRSRGRVKGQAAVGAHRVHLEPRQAHRVAGRRSGNVRNDDIARARGAEVGGAQVIDQLRAERHRIKGGARLLLGDGQVHDRSGHVVRQFHAVVARVRFRRGRRHRRRVDVTDREAGGGAAEGEAGPDLLPDLIGLAAVDRPHVTGDLAVRIGLDARGPALGRGRRPDQFKPRRIDDVLDHHARGRVRPQAAHADGVGRHHAHLRRVGRDGLGVQGDVRDRRDVIGGRRLVVRQIELSRVRRSHAGDVVEAAAFNRSTDAHHGAFALASGQVGHGPTDTAVRGRIGGRALRSRRHAEARDKAAAIDEVRQVVGDDHGARDIAAQVADREANIEGVVRDGDRQVRRL